MFHKFEQRINDLASGTIDTFCVRCHQQVGTQMGEKREVPLWERSEIAREGITCITCHRVSDRVWWCGRQYERSTYWCRFWWQ